MAEVFDIGHESDLSEYTSTVTDGGDLSQSGAAAMGGTSGGMQALIDDLTEIYGEKTYTQITSTSYRFRFYVDPNSMTIGSGDNFVVCRMLVNGSWRVSVRLGYDGSSFEVSMVLYDDNLSSQTLGPYDISDAEHYVEVLVTYASGPSANDGVMTLWVDGSQQGTDTTLDLYNTTKPNEARLGAVVGIDSGTSGTFYLDEFVLRDDDTEIGPVSGGGVPIGAIAMGGYRRRRAA